MDWKFWLPFFVAAIGSLYQALSYYQAKRATGQGAFTMKRPHIVAGIFMVLTWGALAFYYYDNRGSVRAYTSATPCQLRLSPGEYGKVLDFLREHREERVKKVEIVVEQGRENDCLYAQDLRRVFNLGAWGPAKIVPGTPQGKAVWFESSVNDALARTFWEQTLCSLSQDFNHEEQEYVASSTWMFFIRDEEGEIENYSLKVMCPNKRPGYKSPLQPRGLGE